MVGFAHTRFLVHHTFLSDGVICEIDHRVGILSRPFPLQPQIEICRVRRFPTYRTHSERLQLLRIYTSNCHCEGFSPWQSRPITGKVPVRRTRVSDAPQYDA